MSGGNETDRAKSPPRQAFTCPICKRRVNISPAESAAQAKYFPFCSERCKLIDLGAWLDADYRIPSRPDEESEQPPGGAPPHGDEP